MDHADAVTSAVSLSIAARPVAIVNVEGCHPMNTNLFAQLTTEKTTNRIYNNIE